MSWYVWLIIIAVLGSIIGGLKMLKDTARKLPLSEEQLERIKKRNQELDAKEHDDR